MSTNSIFQIYIKRTATWRRGATLCSEMPHHIDVKFTIYTGNSGPERHNPVGGALFFGPMRRHQDS